MTTHLPLLAGRSYHCQCGSPVFFRNSECLSCSTPLGYDSALATLLPLIPGQGINTWMQWQPAPKPLPAQGGVTGGANSRWQNAVLQPLRQPDHTGGLQLADTSNA